MNFVWHGKSTTSELLPCQSRVARRSLPCLIALPYLIQNFDSDAMLLPCFCQTLLLNLIRHHRKTTSEHCLNYDMKHPRGNEIYRCMLINMLLDIDTEIFVAVVITKIVLN